MPTALSMLITALAADKSDPDKDPPPCTEGPSESSGSLEFSAYTPEGGVSAAVGSHDGHTFALGRLGIGDGYGVAVSSEGALPIGPSPSAESGWQVALTANFGLTLKLPLIPFGFAFPGDVGFGYDSNTGFDPVVNLPSLPSGDWPAPDRTGIEKFWSIGLSVAGYTDRTNVITSKGTCKAHY